MGRAQAFQFDAIIRAVEKRLDQMQLASRGSDACRPRETVRSPARGLLRERLEFEDVAERSVLIPSRRLDESRRGETGNDDLWISALPSSGHECIDVLRCASDVSPMNENLGQVQVWKDLDLSAPVLGGPAQNLVGSDLKLVPLAEMEQGA